jgi:hypothetical protein
VVVGYTHSFGAGDKDLLLSKFDRLGTLLWSRALGGELEDDGYSVVELSDGSLLAWGYTCSFGDNCDMLLSRFDSSGAHLSSETFGGYEADHGFCMTRLSDGGFALVGPTTSFGVSSTDFLFSRFDSSLSLLWSLTIGGTGPDIPYSVKETSDGGFVITGSSRSFGAGLWDDVLISRFDSSGTHLWSRTLGGENLETGRCLVQLSDGGFLITGQTGSSGPGASSIFLSKFDGAGNHVWAKTFGGSQTEGAFSFIRSSEGGIVVTGFTRSFGDGDNDVLLARFDPDFDVLWARALGQFWDDFGYSTVETEGDLVVTGRTRRYPEGDFDLVLARFDSGGVTCSGEFGALTLEPWEPTVSSVTPLVMEVIPEITPVNPTIGEPEPRVTVLCPMCGDADNSGSVTPADGYTVLNFFGGGPAPVYCYAANPSGDGSLSPADGFRILNHLGAGVGLDCISCESPPWSQ